MTNNEILGSLIRSFYSTTVNTAVKMILGVLSVIPHNTGSDANALPLYRQRIHPHTRGAVLAVLYQC
jgi:hypothetical protein